MLEVVVIALGILVSFFLKDVNFLSLNFSFLNTGILYPDFLLMFLIFFALQRGEFSGIWIGFFSGLLEDSAILRFSENTREFVPIIGVYTAVYTITGFTLGKTNRLVDKDSTMPIMVLVFFSVVVVRFLVWLAMGIINEFNHSYSFLGPAFYTAIISPVWFFILGWIYRPKLEQPR